MNQKELAGPTAADDTEGHVLSAKHADAESADRADDTEGHGGNFPVGDDDTQGHGGRFRA